jgi:hypothetical protein
MVPVVVAAALRSAALGSLLRCLLNLGKRLLRPGEIAGLQVLAERLEILRKG